MLQTADLVGVGWLSTHRGEVHRGEVEALRAQRMLSGSEVSERFHIRAKLGEGGMGVVYEAFDRDLGAPVALKTLRSLSPEAVLRLKHEFRALADVHHENLITLGELFEQDGKWFFSMELVDGVDLLSWVRRDPSGVLMNTTADCSDPSRNRFDAPPPSSTGSAASLDLQRLRHALVQVARGLMALHASGMVHRDIKPANILVTRGGRVRILDFGIIASVGGVDEGRLMGTPRYMAPEQSGGQPVDPPADWYALGAVLYEALTGHPPFVGQTFALLLAKLKEDPTPPGRLVAGVPADLEALCVRLLVRDPAARASGKEVLERLGAEAEDSPRLPAVPFVGRRDELAALQAALDLAGAGALLMAVTGESGIGKSALVRHFVEQLPPECLVLRGRCYERELVPYKAIDGVIDAASRVIARLPRDQAQALRPLHAAALTRLFPVLDWDAPADEPELSQMEPRAVRARAVAALRELLVSLARMGPLVITIDDFQWADADSLELLAELLRAPESLPALVVVTVRGGGEGAWTKLGGTQRRLQLASLPLDEAATLARHHVRALDGGGAVDGEAIAVEASGHPLFIAELVRCVYAAGEARPPLRLEEALGMRVERLEASARRLLELLSVAAGPIPAGAAINACELQPQPFAGLVAQLRAGHLLRSSDGSGVGQSRLEPYHDRVRMAVQAHLAPERRAEIHRRLAVSLEAAPDAEPETLALHWQGAGDLPAAARWAERAADEATRGLAFERAARLYRLARELGGPTGEAARRIATNLGEALASCGRSFEAAEAFRDAADEAPVEEALELQRRSAQQYLSCGHIDRGVAAIREVMASVGLKLPETPNRALLSLLVARARLRLRGLRFRQRPESALTLEQRMRIDATWTVSLTLGAVDTIVGADCQARNLLYALDAGEPFRIARALLREASFAAVAGPSAAGRVERLLRPAEALAAEIDHPYAIAMALLTRGFACFFAGRFREALGWFRRGEAILRERCREVAYELTSIHLFSLWALYYLGEVKEVTAELASGIAEARERGDLAAVTNLVTRAAHVVALADDDPARARAETEEAERGWSNRGFFAQHYHALFAQAQIDLYGGDATAATHRLEAAWRELSRSLLLRVQLLHVEALHLRARAALRAAIRPSQRRRALAEARTYARTIAGMKLDWGGPLAQLVLAGAAAQAGRADEALQELDRALAGLDAAGLRLYAAAARRRRGELVGGDEGRGAITAADDLMAAERIRNPRRITAMLVPGFPDDGA